jgi:hypothetical protein
MSNSIIHLEIRYGVICENFLAVELDLRGFKLINNILFHNV